ncbi:MAG TPA: apolipoprotein N-acyltransferase [Rectinema sp.]|jgi:apolipoprotein N-acyltransferase|nr:apolipoprotein N-acyltransferase [Spirochaetaceae bacterium]HNV18184.1 apolipoprotein N-acyltransferase [Rectinema sp.]HNY98504.1 apolipoprotein N-acyltransferase [Rectinema sp.]HOE75527.1 apolipoprotein N-acyltransferase [Rectinema sp.]HOH05255.1 apolipoprotein N-acyltransferase [Rectinema sp.]
MNELAKGLHRHNILKPENLSSFSTPFWIRLLWAFLAALFAALAQPNELFLYGNWFFGLFCLVPLYMALVDTEKLEEASLIGALFGALYHALTSYWLFFYKNFAFWTLGTTTIAYAVIYGVALMYGCFFLHHTDGCRPLAFALAWAALEFAKSTGFLGYPWGLLAYSFTGLPIMLQTADLWGVYGISAFLALCSSATSELILQKTRKMSPLKSCFRWPTIAGTWAIILLLYGALTISRPIPIRATLRLLLCQQNTDPWISGENEALYANIKVAKEALKSIQEEKGAMPDLIVFSETSLRRPYKDFQSWFEHNPPEEPLLPFLRNANIPLLTGLPVVWNWDTNEASNSVGIIYPTGKIGETYAKIHPVPFAEAIPFWEFSWFRSFIQNVIGLESGWVMGNEEVIFALSPKNRDDGMNGMNTLPTIRFATPICFEDAFSELCRDFIHRGADLLINLTNDSWSRTKSAQIQHYAVARLRAIETRRALVRSTNSGVTCVIGSDGRNIAELPQFINASMVVDVPIYESRFTFYLNFGDWFAWVCADFVGLLFIWAILDTKRKNYVIQSNINHL